MNMIYTPDTDQFRLSDEQIFGQAPLPANLQQILVDIGFESEEVKKILVKGRSVVSSRAINQLRENYQKMKDAQIRLPRKVGIVTYSRGFRDPARARTDDTKPYEVPEGISLYYLPKDLFFPDFYTVDLGESTIQPKSVEDALGWLGLSLPEGHKVPETLRRAIMQLKDDTFGETEKIWRFEEFMDTLKNNGSTILTDIYIRDALPEINKFKYAETGFKL